MNSHLQASRVFAWMLLVCGLPAAAGGMLEEHCAEAVSTIEINQCLYDQVLQAEQQQEDYLTAARQQLAEEDQALTAMEQAQESWLTFRNAHCAAVYMLWQDGSIRGAMHNQCLLEHTRARTRDIWQVYLTAMDGSDPLLPDPSVTDAATDGAVQTEN